MNIRLNKKAAAFAGGVVSMACLVACGDDITQVTNVGMDSVAAYEDLSECTTQNEGVLIYVKDKGNTYLCSDESWHSVKGEDGKNGTNGTNGNDGKNGTNGKNGENGTSCSAKATDGGIQVSCGGTVIGTLTNGKNGDNCSIAEVENGAEVTCGTSKVTIKNGTNGAAGSNGTNGTNGDDCTVSKTGGVATVVCGASSVQISDGSAGANCSVAETEDGATITCGSNVVTVPKGAAGTNGKSAYELAVEKGYTGTLDEWLASLVGAQGAAGSNGTNGTNGKSAYELAVEKGYTGTLDEWLASLVGAQGAAGSNGTNGTNGKSAYELAVENGYTGTLTEWIASLKGVKGDAGENCTFVTGDNDGEIVLTCGEKQTTLYKAVCGTTPYDPATKFCFNMELNDLCGTDKKAFDPTKFECVEGVVQEKVAMESCGSDEYNPKTHFCAKKGTTVMGVYKKVTIGEGENAQTWMAENLNYITENSWCGGGDGPTAGDCSVYGRLYTYDAAMAACPDGWHLPTMAEFETLITSAGGSSAGKALKSKSDWDGSDDFAFSALPAGLREYSGNFDYEGYNAYFWSSTESDIAEAYYMDLGRYDDCAFLFSDEKGYGYSVRCLKD